MSVPPTSSNTTITGTVTVVPCAMGAPATFTVTSLGYSGLTPPGFVSVPGTTPTVATVTSQPAPIIPPTPAPAPQIWFQNSNVSNTNITGNGNNPQQVVVGQLIGLSAVVPPTACGVTQQSWGISGGSDNKGGTAVGGWASAPYLGGVVPAPFSGLGPNAMPPDNTAHPAL
jgi:hypothetical protein